MSKQDSNYTKRQHETDEMKNFSNGSAGVDGKNKRLKR